MFFAIKQEEVISTLELFDKEAIISNQYPLINMSFNLLLHIHLYRERESIRKHANVDFDSFILLCAK